MPSTTLLCTIFCTRGRLVLTGAAYQKNFKEHREHSHEYERKDK